ncbi:MAG: beta-galactosidase [Candidatus Sungbacteria bacterium]|nr:beta-galactosidase [Candidatus Sungbacteria bacterium]
MSWLLISILSNTILAFSAVFDKLLLGRSIKDPLIYAFWTAISSLAAVVLIPFGSISVSWDIFWLALATGAIWFWGALFFMIAISRGEASTALPLIGALAPIATFFTSAAFLDGGLGVTEYFGFFFLVFGGFIFLIAEEPKLRMPVFIAAGLSAVFFGISNALLNPVFLHSSFVAGIFWTRIGAVIAAATLLFSSKVRERLFAVAHAGNIRDWIMYWGNRILAAGGVILNFYPFVLAHPALVDAANGFKYAVIVFLGWIILGERFRGKILMLKVLATALIIGGLLWFGLGEYASSIPVDGSREIQWGITFSHKFSRDLGLNWRENFNAILYEVKPHKIRLVAYWDEIERERGKYDFSDLDWMMDRARESGTEIILAVGLRVPRWPECHVPEWAQNLELRTQNLAVHEYMRAVVERYKNNPAIKMWQVENEPYLRFGECPERESGFLEREIALVKSVDPSRPILVTDGGEFGDWYRASKAGDVFGTTMYRRAYPRFIGPIFGVIEYPLSPAYFRFKEKLIRWIVGNYDKKFIVIELQGEPWSSVQLRDVSLEEQFRIFDLEYFRDTIRYARDTGFDEYYLWGAEWWYWLGKKHNDWRFWDEAKGLLRN